MRKAIVVDDDPITRMDIADILSRANFDVVAQGGDGFDAVELCSTHHPDLVLMDIKMPIFDGLDATRTIMRDDLAGCVVILSAFNDEDFIAKAKEFGVSSYLVKPINERMLLPAVEIALAQSERIRQMLDEKESIRKKLEQKSLIDRAKAMLAKKAGVSEGQAHAMIQKMSMDKSVSMAEIAKKIVDAEDDRSIVGEAKALLMARHGIGENAAYRRIQRYAESHGYSISQAAKALISEISK